MTNSVTLTVALDPTAYAEALAHYRQVERELMSTLNPGDVCELHNRKVRTIAHLVPLLGKVYMEDGSRYYVEHIRGVM